MTDPRSLRRRLPSTIFEIGLLTGLLTNYWVRPAAAAVVYQNNFEDDAVGTYTVANLAADWNGTTSNDGVDEGRVSITDDQHAVGNKSLVVMYPAGQWTSGKSQWKTDLGGNYEELFLSYRIRFDDSFDFVRGGKLPGLSGGADNSGGNKPNGVDGWSARMMWRTNGSSGAPTSGDTANIVQYTYHPDQPTEFGDDMRWDDTAPTDWKVFESDRWYHLQHRVKMNTVGARGSQGNHDGVIQAWLDGEMVLDRQDIRFRDIGALAIDNFYFSTFFGGGSDIWAATKDEHVYYDDFVIATEFITIPGDFNGDGKVDNGDLGLWESGYGATDGGDADGDFDSDGADFLTWQQNYTGDLSSPPSALVAVPEPSTAIMAGIMAAFFAMSSQVLALSSSPNLR